MRAKRTITRLTLLPLLAWLLAACSLPHTVRDGGSHHAGTDPHSYANTDDFVTSHLVLDLDVDFEQRQLSGTVELQLKRLNPHATELVLDTRELSIRDVWYQAADGSWQATAFALDAPDPILGRALRIQLTADSDAVRIAYSTAPTASGLQWLTPEQTADGKHPFLFSQSQAIHARSWIPVQDTPGVRASYEATVRAPKGLLALMSAENDPEAKRDGKFQFRMPQPIPAYLIALAVGDLRFQAMSERTGVYAEPSVLKAAAAEFDDTEAMMVVTEKLYGPYLWGRYDLLILPPSFPYGGMENPRLTFASPTVIAGDKSLVSLVAHELAHSWSGNLVTNSNWNNFWLNEGFTNHLTFRIMEEVFGDERGLMERSIGYQNLQATLARMEDPRDRSLDPDISGRDPDEGVTSVPYNRGALFLWNIQQAYGEARFDSFLREWFEAKAFQSVTTHEFVHFLKERLLKDDPDKFRYEQVHSWIHDPALPEGHLVPESDAFARVDAQRTAWLEGRIKATAMGSEKWSSREWEHFFNALGDDLSLKQLQALSRDLRLTFTDNAIIASKWFEIAIKNNYEPASPYIAKYLQKIGRMKLTVPLYRAMAATDTGRERARAIYAEARSGYHPIAQATIDKLLADKS